MSLRHALLGLLVNTPQTGYDLAKHFDETLSKHAWHASHSQIYPELKRMAADGLVHVVDSGARGSKTYDVTPEGRAELRRWMFRPPGGTRARNEFALWLFLLPSLDRADMRVLVEEMSAASERELLAVQRDITQMDETTPPGQPPRYARLVAEFGRRYYQLERDWAQWVLSQVDGVD